jgi:hypothetical protein
VEINHNFEAIDAGLDDQRVLRSEQITSHPRLVKQFRYIPAREYVVAFECNRADDKDKNISDDSECAMLDHCGCEFAVKDLQMN